MRKINETNDTEKSVLVGDQNTFNINQIEHLAGDSNGLSAFDSTQNHKNLQCGKCNPPIYKRSGAIKLCANCEAEAAQTAAAFFDNFRQHRKVTRLDCYCFACSTPKSSAVMSKVLPICRCCAGELKSKNATAKNKIIALTLNNFLKKLKGGAV